MALITRVDIEGFRCFKKLSVDGLSRVNVFVGKNNSGKTALLEAIEAVALNHLSPFLHYRASAQRGEWRARGLPPNDVAELDIRHLFYGHRNGVGSSFKIRAARGDDRWSLTRTITEPRPEIDSDIPSSLGACDLRSELLREDSSSERGMRQMHIPLTSDGFLGAGTPGAFRGVAEQRKPPVRFMSTAPMGGVELVDMWGGVVLTPLEDLVAQAIKLVEPKVARIAMSRRGDAADVQVLLSGSNAPVPLGNLGEGVTRVLALALSLVKSAGGTLLIDEIENGVHWSVMPKIWEFLVRTARAHDVQVFLTTHSKDCIEAIGSLATDHPDLASDVSVHRLEAGRETAVRLDASRIAEYVASDSEPR